jgi:hypothetical protein
MWWEYKYICCLFSSDKTSCIIINGAITVTFLVHLVLHISHDAVIADLRFAYIENSIDIEKEMTLKTSPYFLL